MTRLVLMGLCVGLLAGCAIPATTKVTKDGFMARQKTTEAHRAVVGDYDVYRTDCRYDQLMKDADGVYYCPPDATKEAYNSRVYPATHQVSVAETYGPPLITGAAIVTGAGLLMHGMQTQAVPQTNLSVAQSNMVNGSTVRTSTLLINAPVPGGVAP